MRGAMFSRTLQRTPLAPGARALGFLKKSPSAWRGGGARNLSVPGLVWSES